MFSKKNTRQKNNPSTVKGYDIPPARLTLWGKIYAMWYVALPVLLVLTAVDVVLYFYFSIVLNRCYGVLCFF